MREFQNASHEGIDAYFTRLRLLRGVIRGISFSLVANESETLNPYLARHISSKS